MLTGAQRAELRDLIVEVFDRRALAQALDAAEPSRDFDALVAEGPFNDQVFQLVKLANQQGWVEQLYSFVCARISREHILARLAALEVAGPAEAVTPRGAARKDIPARLAPPEGGRPSEQIDRVPAVAVSADPNSGYRFEVALSFAGDNKRDRVRRVAEILQDKLGDGKVFFDEWYEHEIAGHDADIVLQGIYKRKTRLVVTCVCKRYQEKPWTQAEWRAIRAFETTLRDAGTENVKRMRFLPVRFGDGEIDGLFSELTIVPDVRDRPPEKIAALILQRLRLAAGSEAPPSGLPTREAELRYLKRLRSEIEQKAQLYSPLRGVVTEDPEKRLSQLLHAWKGEDDLALLRYRPRPRNEEAEAAPCDYDDVLAAFAEVKQAALLGDPGSGKSTTLRQLALELAEKAEQDPAAPLPLLVSLGAWKGEKSLAAFLAERVPEIGGAVRPLSQAHRLVLLLDGLNEVPAGERADKAAELMELKDELAGDTPFFVSCRIKDYANELALRVDSLTLEPLSPQQVRAALRNWVGQSGGDSDKADRLFWQLSGDEALEGALEQWLEAGFSEDAFWAGDDELPLWEEYGWREFQARHRWLNNRRSLLRLAANPFLLTMLYQNWVAFGEELPDNRGELFEQFVNRLLFREKLLELTPHSQAGKRTPEGERLVEGLTALAWRMQRPAADSSPGENGESGAETVASRTEVVEALGSEALFGKALAATLLEGEDEIRFRHQLLQEYFAARALDQRLDQLEATELWPAERWWERSGWEETCVLLAGFYPNDCKRIVSWLAEAQPEVAAQCIAESGAKLANEARMRQSLSGSWLPRLTDIRREPAPEGREAVGRALGRLGWDDRKGVGVGPDGLPDIDWIEIPGGTFVYQEDERRPIETFWMARYPVSNTQFQAFLEAEDGYRDDRCWERLTDPDRTPLPGSWNLSNHPRETVSWHEAMAFCAWMSRRTGKLVQLPTEWQWERTARGLEGRAYPWGDEYLAGRANVDETIGDVGPHSLGRTSAVGIYPEGASVGEQVMDLAGNVWEWSLNEYEGPAKTQPGGTRFRALRGGSWSFAQGDARAVCRLGRHPNVGNLFIGFRVVCSSPIR